MTPVLVKDTVEQIARLYDAEYDPRADIFPDDYLDRLHLTNQELTAEGYRYPIRSHLTVDELQRIMDWKFPRGKTRGLAQQNGTTKVGAVTQRAFSRSDPSEAIAELCQLKGVGVAMGSAILTAFNPLRFTVIDFRAWNALKTLNLLDALCLAELDGQYDSPIAYRNYLEACVQLSIQADVSLRSLDRCLWVLDASAP